MGEKIQKSNKTVSKLKILFSFYDFENPTRDQKKRISHTFKTLFNGYIQTAKIVAIISFLLTFAFLPLFIFRDLRTVPFQKFLYLAKGQSAFTL